MKCVIFRCSKKTEMYLYVPYCEDADDLLKRSSCRTGKLTGNLEKVMELDLTPDRKLARAETKDVIASLQEKGFYLQSPPNELLRKDQSMLHTPSDSFLSDSGLSLLPKRNNQVNHS